MKPRMDANERELLLKEAVYAVVGAAIDSCPFAFISG
jgi:hypothetical protein